MQRGDGNGGVGPERLGKVMRTGQAEPLSQVNKPRVGLEEV